MSATTVVERPLAKEMLFQLQRRALTNDDAAHEIAYRYASSPRAGVYAEQDGKFFNRIVTAFLDGLEGTEDQYARGRGGNFTRPLSRAWKAGAELRAELLRADMVKVTR